MNNKYEEFKKPNKATEWTPSPIDNTPTMSSLFDELEGFTMVEILEHKKNLLKTKFKNNTGEERIVTQTADGITITWNTEESE